VTGDRSHEGIGDQVGSAREGIGDVDGLSRSEELRTHERCLEQGPQRDRIGVGVHAPEPVQDLDAGDICSSVMQAGLHEVAVQPHVHESEIVDALLRPQEMFERRIDGSPCLDPWRRCRAWPDPDLMQHFRDAHGPTVARIGPLAARHWRHVMMTRDSHRPPCRDVVDGPSCSGTSVDIARHRAIHHGFEAWFP